MVIMSRRYSIDWKLSLWSWKDDRKQMDCTGIYWMIPWRDGSTFGGISVPLVYVKLWSSCLPATWVVGLPAQGGRHPIACCTRAMEDFAAKPALSETSPSLACAFACAPFWVRTDPHGLGAFTRSYPGPCLCSPTRNQRMVISPAGKKVTLT